MENQASEIDQSGMRELRALTDRIAPRWQVGMLDVLQQRNPELLSKMDTLEDQIDGLLLIVVKPKEIKKKWADTLDAYERAVNAAIAYAERHLTRVQA